jgi:hypothetical protein
MHLSSDSFIVNSYMFHNADGHLQRFDNSSGDRQWRMLVLSFISLAFFYIKLLIFSRVLDLSDYPVLVSISNIELPLNRESFSFC